MNARRRMIEWSVLGIVSFIMTRAILSQLLDPGDTTTTTTTSADGNATYQMILSLCYLSVACILAPYYRQVLYVLRRNWFLAALLLMAFVSVSWSGVPALTFRRAISVFGTTLVGLAFAVLLSAEEQLRLLSRICRTAALLSLGCVILLPSYGISPAVDHRWQGVFSYKSILGFVMAISILVEWQLPTPTAFSKLMNRLALLLSAVVLFFAGSLTPTASLLGSILLVEVYKFAHQRLRISQAVTILAILLIVTSGAVIFVTNTETITTAVGRTSDLTGRTDIWAGMASAILERPLLGYGYSGFVLEDSAAGAAVSRAVGGSSVMYSHNGYLDVLLNFGVVGFALMLIFLGAGVRRALYWSDHNRSSMRFWPLAFILFFVFQNLAEVTIFSMQELQWIVCVAVVASTDPVMLVMEEDEDSEELLLEPNIVLSQN